MTVARIARLAGVSAPTVSRVINGQSGVALGTRQRVEAVLREHGYRRPESGPRIKILELVFKALDSPWALEIMRGVGQTAEEQGLSVVLTEMEGRATPGKAWMQRVLARHPVGVIAAVSELTSEQQSQLASRGIPLVMVDPSGEPLYETPSVGATNWNGGLAATRHLLGRGHRRIAMITGPPDFMCGVARQDGFRAAMSEAQVPIDARLMRSSTLYVEGGKSAALELLRLDRPPTAIFAANDMQALGIYQAARELRLRIPDDLSVVGFDDLPLAEWAGPPLTTVRQPLVHMGAAAASMLMSLARGEKLAQQRVELATRLIVRESTAPVSARA